MIEQAPLLPTSLLFLIGLRGTGKSTVARLLAAQLGWNWLDADDFLETHQGRSIRQIFAEEGESAFRDQEAALLKELCNKRQHIIATGGGVILRAQSRERMRTCGRVAWLTAEVETLWQRLQGDTATSERRPPLITGGRAEVEELMRVREPLYHACADFRVDTTRRSPDEVAAIILAHWKQGVE